jgi:cytochrome c-type biogenesis protein CcmH
MVLLFFTPSFADTQMTPAQEHRYNQLGQEIRCVVCQSEPVATSSAKIAQDMRNVIKVRIMAGDSDDQVRQYFASHYGEYVLLRPQVNHATWALWLAPLFFLILGGVVVMGYFRNSPQVVNTDDEEALKALDEIIR